MENNSRAIEKSGGLNRGIRSVEGSVSIEAAISFSVTLIIMMILIGTMTSVVINERINEITLELTGDMQLLSLPFFETEDVVRRELNEAIMEQVLLSKVKERLKSENLHRFVEINPIKTALETQLLTDGELIFNLTYAFTIPTLLGEQEITYPFIGVIHSDGVMYESELVYVTRLGERYHEADCFHLRKSKIPIDKDEAIRQQISPCKNCHPELKVK